MTLFFLLYVSFFGALRPHNKFSVSIRFNVNTNVGFAVILYDLVSPFFSLDYYFFQSLIMIPSTPLLSKSFLSRRILFSFITIIARWLWWFFLQVAVCAWICLCTASVSDRIYTFTFVSYISVIYTHTHTHIHTGCRSRILLNAFWEFPIVWFFLNKKCKMNETYTFLKKIIKLSTNMMKYLKKSMTFKPYQLIFSLYLFP